MSQDDVILPAPAFQYLLTFHIPCLLFCRQANYFRHEHFDRSWNEKEFSFGWDGGIQIFTRVIFEKLSFSMTSSSMMMTPTPTPTPTFVERRRWRKRQFLLVTTTTGTSPLLSQQFNCSDDKWLCDTINNTWFSFAWEGSEIYEFKTSSG